jgi:hypothetical protein
VTVREAREQIKAMRYWGLALALIGGVGLGVTVSFPAAFAMLVLLWGNNLEQTSRRYEEVLEREIKERQS